MGAPGNGSWTVEKKMEKTTNVFKNFKLDFKVGKIIIRGSEVFQINIFLNFLQFTKYIKRKRILTMWHNL